MQVGIVGGGPIGLVEAAMICAMDSKRKVIVLEQREQPVRNHGLNIDPSIIKEVCEKFDECRLRLEDSMSEENMQKLESLLKSWSGKFIKTSQIENELEKLVTEMGVKVLRGEKVTIDHLNGLESQLPENRIGEIFKDSEIIIGADGAHGPVGEFLGKKCDVETMQHLVELKFQTHGYAVPRNYVEASSAASTQGYIEIESMNRDQSEGLKPATLHTFVDKDTYNALRQEDEHGKLKGVFGNSWTLEELQELAKTDYKVKRVYDLHESYLLQLAERGGSCQDEKISTLDLTIYRREFTFKEIGEKKVLLVGDAASGMVLERGFNKGLLEAVHCAMAIGLSKLSDSAFSDYAEYTRELFKKERKWARVKNTGLNVAQSSVASSASTSGVVSSIGESFDSFGNTRAAIFDSSETSSSCILF